MRYAQRRCTRCRCGRFKRPAPWICTWCFWDGPNDFPINCVSNGALVGAMVEGNLITGPEAERIREAFFK
jgi:hypothetical protein